MRLLTRADPWTEHRRRATELGTAEPHAAEILRLYLALLDVWSESPLVTAPRRLVCSRCSESWIYPRMICAGCGNPDTTGLPVYSDAERFPGLRIDACEVCRTYLVTVDLPKNPAAEPVVDELAALPLDLFARERGFTKITPNLVGF